MQLTHTVQNWAPDRTQAGSQGCKPDSALYPRMVMPVKDSRGSQMNLKGVYRSHQKFIVQDHFSTISCGPASFISCTSKMGAKK